MELQVVGFVELQKEVIGAGLCTGCGTCVGICPKQCIVFDYEEEEPRLVGECLRHCKLCCESCPGKDIPLPELDRLVFGRERQNGEEQLLGINEEFLKGHAVDRKVRFGGASGGVVSALMIYALEKGIVDGVVLAPMDEKKPWRVTPEVATNKREIMSASQSKLVLVPSNSVLTKAVDGGFKKLGLVGLPCHIHAIRKMQLKGRPKRLLNRIKLMVGLMCGANWSYRATEHVIEELCGVPLNQVAKLEYRGGAYPGMFTVTTKGGRVAAVTSPERRLHSWGFLSDRCTVCYDNTNELADVSVGDFFAPEAKRGSPGWSAIIIRTNLGKQLVKKAQTAQYIYTSPIPKSQFLFRGGPLEWKKHGAPYRILKRRKHGWPTPDYHITLEYFKPMPTPGGLAHKYRHPHVL
jgi:coenzyme F420 hydrogenase subunit beta